MKKVIFCLSLAVLILAAAALVLQIVLLARLGTNADVGVIGGADGPTAILVSRSGFRWLPMAGVLLPIAAAVAGVIWAGKR